MKTIQAENVILPLERLIKGCLVNVEKAAVRHIKNAAENEDNPAAAWALNAIVKNNILASENGAYACQDCGLGVLFVNVGQDIHITGNLTDALNKGVEQGYKAARKSVAHSLERDNTLTNTPAVVHYDVIPGDKLEIFFLAKGAGAENMSRLYMLTPSKGEDGIISSVVDAVKTAGANPCPPVILGVGIGGTMEKAALLSKRALIRETGKPSENPNVSRLEKKILDAVNMTGIGAQGFGGKTTALAVHIETFPTHIGMLPVAVNFQCHCVRHGKIEL